jgi:hypothetical protein
LLKDRCNSGAHFGVLRDADILATGTTVADDGEEITDCIVNCHSLTNGFSVGVECLGGLPRRFCHTRNLALCGKFTECETRETELTDESTWTTGDGATVTSTDR